MWSSGLIMKNIITGTPHNADERPKFALLAPAYSENARWGRMGEDMRLRGRNNRRAERYSQWAGNHGGESQC